MTDFASLTQVKPRAFPSGKAAADWADFDIAYAQTDWSKYRNIPAFDANNRGNAYRIFLEMERSEFKTPNR